MIEKRALSKSISEVVIMLIVIIIANSGVWAEEMVKLTPDVVNIDTLDLEEIRRNHSLWELLGERTIRGSLGAKIKADVSYIDPRTYVLMLTEEKGELADDQMMMGELHNVYDNFLLFYIVLKSHGDPESVDLARWRMFLMDDVNNKYEPIKVVGGEPELTYGYSGNYYASKVYLYFPKSGHGDRPVLHEKTKWMKIHIVGELAKGEFTWKFLSDGGGEGDTDYFNKGFKIGLVGAVIVLGLSLWLSRPPKKWTESTG